MKRSGATIGGLALALGFGAATACSPGTGREPPRHVLLLVIDTQRADHLGCYGYGRPTSPVLDALAAEGVRFERCVSQCSWTLPSMISLMTSRYLACELLDIPASEPVLAEAYRAAGYATGAFICNDLLSPKHGFDRGFDVCEWQMTPYGSNQPILDWIARNRDGRTFTFVHLNEVHDPYGFEPYEEHAVYRNERPGFSPERTAFYDRTSEELHLVEKEASLDRMQAEIGGYDDDVVYSDNRIREIFQAYKDLGLWDETAVVVGADHGEGLFTRVQFLHGTRKKALEEGQPPTLFNTLHMTHGSHVNWELVHVPLIVKAPGVAPGTVPAVVENVDIVPTLLDLSGLPVPAGAQGRSLRLQLLDPRSREGVVPAATSLTRYNTTAITQEGMQLVHPTARGECDFAIEEELYDLRADPEERRNLASERLGVVRELARLCDARVSSGICGTTRIVDPEELGVLAGMGYIANDVVDTVHEELAAKSTEALLAELTAEPDCLIRLQIVRALGERRLAPAEKATLEPLGSNDASRAVREGIRLLLAR